MGIYKRGRPHRSRPDSIKDIPKKPGEYSIHQNDGVYLYIGETNNLHRRSKEHRKSGKLSENRYIDYQLADGRSTSRTRRIHEQQSIEKHHPLLNKSVGGEGRPASRIGAKQLVTLDQTPPSSGITGMLHSFIRRLLRVFLAIIFLALLAGIVLAVFHFNLNKKLLIIPVFGVIVFAIIITVLR